MPTLPLTASRELDALVAERVMGVAVAEYPKHHEDVWVEGRTITEWTEELPAYSTSIAAAWTVVEHLHSKGIRGMSLHTEDDGWRFQISHPIRGTCGHEHWDTHEGIADTAPLAICLAALKAVE